MKKKTNKKNISILGATGSIGLNTLDVIKKHQNKFRVSAVTAHKNLKLLKKIAKTFSPEIIVLTSDEIKSEVKKSDFPKGTKILFGKEGLLKAATQKNADIIVSALVGAAGIEPTIEAIKNGKIIALANKEVLVSAGEYIAKKYPYELKNNIIPVDSEHSAIAQSLRGENSKSIEKLILTASGGPFFKTPKREFKKITPEKALAHPNWSMGKKISIDSATMMNKGLEVIEAKWLFNVDVEKIEVLIHPQSIIHSMVQFIDGTVIAQMNIADMRIPIQFALSYPDRIKNTYGRINFPKIGELTFFKPDFSKFTLLSFAYKVIKKGGIYPAVMNAANEIAVESFLARKISFDKIPVLVKKITLSFKAVRKLTLDEILKADKKARLEAKNWVQKNLLK